MSYVFGCTQENVKSCLVQSGVSSVEVGLVISNLQKLITDSMAITLLDIWR